MLRPSFALLGPVAAILLAAVGCGPVDTATPAPGTPPVASDVPAETREMEQAITENVNDQRREHGLDALEPRDDLAAVAREYSQRMLDEGFFDHVSPEGGDVSDRVLEAGITFRIVGENLYLGQGPVDHVGVSVEGWMESPGHRENILREEFSQTGVGMAIDGDAARVTQIFLTP